MCANSDNNLLKRMKISGEGNENWGKIDRGDNLDGKESIEQRSSKVEKIKWK